MGTSLPVNGVERSGTDPYQSEPQVLRGEQLNLLQDDRLSWRAFFRRLLKGDYKVAGTRIFGGDPESARIALCRVLEGKPGRYADWEWIDHILSVLGPEAQEHFVRFVCDRFGFEAPARKPDPVRVQEELADVRRGLAGVTAAIKQLTEAVDHIQGGLGK